MGLLDKIFGFNNCQNQRPSRDDYFGINNDSIQSQGLAAWWPVWEPMANGQRAPQALDYGPQGLHMTPSINTLHTPDTSHGTVWYNPQTNIAGVTGLSSGSAQGRAYAKGLIGTQTDPVDFGAIPNYNGALATAYMSTAWCKMTQVGTDFTSSDAPKDNYLYTFDRNDGVGFPGHTLALIQQIPNAGTAGAVAGASVFDNDDSGSVPFGVQSLQQCNDGLWHLICGLYFPLGVGTSPVFGDGVQYVMVDGQVGFIGGVDNPSTGTTIRFGQSLLQVNLGSPQSAVHANTSAVWQFIGADDDGISSSFIGWIGDHRLYTFNWMVGAANQDIVQFALQLAAHMYAPETRWELYQKGRPRPMMNFSQAVITGGQVPYDLQHSPQFQALMAM